MRTPPFLVGAALIFWGWQTGLLVWAAVMALGLEGARWLRWRWEFSATEFNRIWDVTAVLFLSAGIYNYKTDSITNAVLTTLQWLPIVFLPIVAAQAFSASPTIGRSTFFWLLRRKGQPDPAGSGINVAYPYFALCLLAASAANARDIRFYAGVCFLTGFALAAERPRRLPAWVSAAFFLAIAAAGYFAHNWMQDFENNVESRSVKWIFGFFPRELEEQEGYTAMGRIGALKLSGKIIMRVEPEGILPPPTLLRQTSFTRFGQGTWYGTRRNFSPVREYADGRWQLVPKQIGRAHALISTYLPNGRALLALPAGTVRITDLPALEMLQNRLGAVRVSEGPEMASYEIHYTPGLSGDGPPDKNDLEIPGNEQPALTQLAAELGLASRAPREATNTLADFFENHFRYARYSKPGPYKVGESETLLSNFLLKERDGHCEYFATATVLLLRKAGIPARYATGFAVHEASASGKSFLVRERHGHAWALVWLGDHWHDFDTTPASWYDAESANASFLEPISDWWSNLSYKMSRWRWSAKSRTSTKYLVALLGLLMSFLIWSVARKRVGVRLRVEKRRATARRSWPGQDSELYLIEGRLKKVGLGRNPGETFGSWFHRVRSNPALGDSEETLAPVLALHYRYRFDPNGLTGPERATLGSRARAWLAKSKPAR
jgi:transglutaminase-like putative cysteine protease